MNRISESILKIVLMTIPLITFVGITCYDILTDEMSILLLILIIITATSLEILIAFLYVLIGIRNRIEEGNQLRSFYGNKSRKKLRE